MSSDCGIIRPMKPIATDIYTRQVLFNLQSEARRLNLPFDGTAQEAMDQIEEASVRSGWTFWAWTFEGLVAGAGGRGVSMGAKVR